MGRYQWIVQIGQYLSVGQVVQEDQYLYVDEMLIMQSQLLPYRHLVVKHYHGSADNVHT